MAFISVQNGSNLIKLDYSGIKNGHIYKKDRNGCFIFHSFVSDFKIGCGWVEALLCGCVL